MTASFDRQPLEPDVSGDSRTGNVAAALPALETRPLSAVSASALHPKDYRPDIDGLRAVAIIGVLIYHAMPELLPGGFAGVDVFFVISGFLISGIIFRALERGTFSLLDFYTRRVKRIFPALITMLTGVWLLSWPILLWDEYQRLGKHILAGAAFSLNLLLYSDFNLYFGVTTSPLIHLWSLGVEEQFYIVWPLLLAAVWRWRGGRLPVIVAVTVISFMFNIAALPTDLTAAFYLPTSRMWELALGSLLAYANLHPITNSGGVQPRAVAATAPFRWLQLYNDHLRGVLGLGLIVVAYLALNSQLAFPGWWALLPCVGAVLLVSAGPSSWINRHVLASRPMVFIGLISYPLYLWHWPLLSILHISGRATVTTTLMAVAAAVILAVLTYRYIELPIRTARGKTRVAASLCGAMVVCALLGYLTYSQSIASRSDSYDVDSYIRASKENWLPGQSTDWTWYTDDFVKVGEGARQALFIGDSNMQQFYPRIAKLATDQREEARQAVFAVRAGCAPALYSLLQIDSYSAAACRSFMERALEYGLRPEVDTIVIAAYWRLYSAVDVRDFSGTTMRPATDTALEELRRAIAALVARGKRVYVVLHIPTHPLLDPRQMIHRNLQAPAFTVDARSPTRSQVDAAVGPIGRKVRDIASQAGAVIIDPLESLCTATTCPAITAEGEPMYRDFAHLRPSWVREHVRFLDRTVLESG